MTDESQYISYDLFLRTVQELIDKRLDPDYRYLPAGVTIDDLVKAELAQLWPGEYGKDAA